MLVLKNVRVHNLKGVNLSLPKGQLIVFAGVSGSGKSSLAFDTIYAEGQRRYIESLSHSARRLIADLPKPEADAIEGIAPTIAIEQKTASRSPRSTVGTMTGIYDFLRVLYARIGVPYCPVSGEPVAAQSREKIIGAVLAYPEGTKAIVLAPVARGKKGAFQEEFAEWLRRGYMRARVDGSYVELSEKLLLDRDQAHDIDLVVDRIVVKLDEKTRIAESVTAALEAGKGLCSVVANEEETLFSQHAYSAKSGLSYGPLEPHDFSFNHPIGMCPACQGLGTTLEYDLHKVIDFERSIADDCCSIASSASTIRYGNIYRNLARLYKFSLDTPWKNLSKAAQEVFLNGTQEKWTRMLFSHPEKSSRWYEYVAWRGVLHEARERYRAATSDAYRRKMEELMVEAVCPTCQGARIKPYPAATQLSGVRIHEVCAMTLKEADAFFRALKLSPLDIRIAEELLKEIRERLRFLQEVGLEYLSLERTAPTLSGGESQRVRLASLIGSGLVGAIYVLDEPSIGLHPRDHNRLIGTLTHLRDRGNTVLVVEHDADTMLAADLIVDVGPGAGSEGGEILAVGTALQVAAEPRSLTGAYLSGKLEIAVPPKRRKLKPGIEIRGARHHNLRNLDVSIPLGGFVCITGVSGSGKSSLISDTLVPALVNRLHNGRQIVGACDAITGLEKVEKIIAVDQSPIGRTPRSNAATYIKVFDDIRDLYAELPESKLRGFTPSHFSFNAKMGSCPYCGGIGEVKLDMDFLEDAYLPCPQCKGRRFEPEILAVQYKGKNISEILDGNVRDALALFEHQPTIRKKLEVLDRVGLGYLSLGQPSTTLSGGEAQRIKLAKELVRPPQGQTLYILDEPTTGLHIHDIQKLLAVLEALVDRGNTVLVIEHNLDLIKRADWILDIGPEAGASGGKLVGEGTPEHIAKQKTPTGLALKAALKGAPPLKVSPYAAKSSQVTEIQVFGAKENNLKDLTLTLPRGQITVFTGPSGSGKSSLAIDTLYAEGQRRYAETLPPYARAFVEQSPKPKVDRIEGLSPAIALEQKVGGLNPRSTVATMADLYDPLRLLFAHAGVAYCPETGEPICQISKETVLKRTLEQAKGERILILAPISLTRSETFAEFIERLKREGYLRLRLNGTLYDLESEIPFDPKRKNELALVIDRMTADKESSARLLEAIGKAAELSHGWVLIARPSGDLPFNLSFAVEKTGKSYPPLTPQTFSFNSESGMCSECQGLGEVYGAHLAENRSILRLSPLEILDRLCDERGEDLTPLSELLEASGIDPDSPLKEQSAQARDRFFDGAPEHTVRNLTLRWMGLNHTFALLARIGVATLREELLPYLLTAPCPACQGSRLNPLARHVQLGGKTMAQLTALTLDEALPHFTALSLPPLLAEPHRLILRALTFLREIGLGYLALNRSAPTLSGGEMQRIRLARQLGSQLTSCLYVLDEPTIGLHPHNNALLNTALQNLRDLGNTLLVVEHDPQTIEQADWIVDFGPAAGKAGGEITASGTYAQICQNPHSLTGAYLTGRKKIPLPTKRRPLNFGLRIENAHLHNLQHLDVPIPLAALTCVTGVSGSGKSSLIRGLLKPALESALKQRKTPDPYTYLNTTFHGLSHFDNLIVLDQTPLGQTNRADVSTYTDLMPIVRSHFAQMAEAKRRGLLPKHFSPNHLSGMCRTCWGLGYRQVSLQFLPSVRIPCESCQGLRLNPLSLQVQYRDRNLGQVLRLTVDEAARYFELIPRIAKRLTLLQQVGLGYLPLGQEIVSLSGGEAQRLRLSRELSKRETGTTLYLIDEPTIGLHFEDIAHLLPLFHRLVDKGNTLILIEHNLDAIAQADYLLELGPHAGPQGGQLLFAGRPEKLPLSTKTGPFLKKTLASR